ncbi:hypothetical protein SAMN05428642_10399 [Flaviramulus basaltis]|uniref:Uncharacterized protein n=1 Tax=Flaviramulus basaltis TaxID=369401 RepID=A0A1K2IM97_9FLAO|nr:BfmA/BtgA family mobilization protein [Flaviramulus basaltis]SFZ93378.1 hypothetical protein SAMN05428642_10399 [Flaviramulus basaltis]
MDDFTTIRLKKKVIKRFKGYSKRTSPSYSETLDFMVAFFEDTGLSPYDTMRNPILSCTVSMNKRMDAVVSILRNIEKTQLIPTREMLESLFKEVGDEEPVYIERTQKEIEASKTETEKLLDYYMRELDKNNKELYKIKNEFSHMLRKASYVKSTFGKSYYRLDIPREKMEAVMSIFI